MSGSWWNMDYDRALTPAISYLELKHFDFFPPG
jgi:hypothetical protein